MIDINTLISKLTDKMKIWRNSFRIPPLLSWFIAKDGKINPTKEETLKEAPPASENWVRLGLGRSVFGPIKVWHVLALPVVMWSVSKGSAALQFFIEIISQGAMLIPLAIIGYFIFKSFKK